MRNVGKSGRPQQYAFHVLDKLHVRNGKKALRVKRVDNPELKGENIVIVAILQSSRLVSKGAPS